MTDQYTPPTTPAEPAVTPVVTPVAAQPPADSTEPIDSANMPNPASVYDELDDLTLSRDALALSGAMTQVQVDMADESAQVLADVQKLIADEAADVGTSEPTAATPTTAAPAATPEIKPSL
jgi:hypothetical protein